MAKLEGETACSHLPGSGKAASSPSQRKKPRELDDVLSPTFRFSSSLFRATPSRSESVGIANSSRSSLPFFPPPVLGPWIPAGFSSIRQPKKRNGASLPERARRFNSGLPQQQQQQQKLEISEAERPSAASWEALPQQLLLPAGLLLRSRGPLRAKRRKEESPREGERGAGGEQPFARGGEARTAEPPIPALDGGRAGACLALGSTQDSPV